MKVIDSHHEKRFSIAEHLWLYIPMNHRNTLRLATAVAFAYCIAAVCDCRMAHSAVIENPIINGAINWFREFPHSFGDQDQYIAQSFTTPALEPTIDRVGFYISNSVESPSRGFATNAPLPLRFLLVTVVRDANGIRPDQVLYETPFSVPYAYPGQFPPPLTEIDLPNTALLPATEYALVLDALTDASFSDNVAPMANVTQGTAYDFGEFFSYAVPWDDVNGPIGTRADHFSADWDDFGTHNIDMAIRVTFVPEPPAFLLTLAAIAGLFRFAPRMRACK